MKKKILRVSLVLTFVVAVLVTSALADTSTLTTTMTSSFQTVVTDCLSMIGSILPIGLTLFGASIAVAYAIKFFKKVVGK